MLPVGAHHTPLCLVVFWALPWGTFTIIINSNRTPPFLGGFEAPGNQVEKQAMWGPGGLHQAAPLVFIRRLYDVPLSNRRFKSVRPQWCQDWAFLEYAVGVTRYQKETFYILKVNILMTKINYRIKWAYLLNNWWVGYNSLWFSCDHIQNWLIE